MKKHAEKNREYRRLRGRRGFSLIAVLIASIIGLALMAAVLQVSVSASGSARAESAKAAKYNILEGGVESGKAALRKMMDNDKTPPRYFTGPTEPADPINTAADLLIKGDDPGIPILNGVVLDKTLDRNELGPLGIAGSTGKLKVEIFDMQYSPELAPGVGKITKEERDKIPPSIMVNAPGGSGSDDGGAPPEPDATNVVTSGASVNAGAYLIRATFEIGGRETVLESALIQANKS